MSRLIQGILIATLLLVTHPLLFADESSTAGKSASVLLAPARCVALHQGQMCYQLVQISWSSFTSGNYCLFLEGQEQPLRCWQAQTQGTFEYEFASDNSRLLQLKNTSQQIVAEATLEVAWVYKANTRRKTHWRLF